MIRVFFLLFIVLITFSCNKEEETDISIKLISKTGYISSNSELTYNQKGSFSIIAESKGEENFVSNVEILRNKNVYFDTTINQQEVKFVLNFTQDLQDTVKWDFIVTDAEGNQAKRSIYIFLETGIIKQYRDTTNMRFEINDSAENTFIYFRKGLIYSKDTAHNFSNKIDAFIHYDSVSQIFQLQSPGNDFDSTFIKANNLHKFGQRNITRFTPQVFNENLFDLPQNDSIIIDYFVNSETNNEISEVLQGGISAFKTNNGIYGLIKIDSIVNGTVKKYSLN